MKRTALFLAALMAASLALSGCGAAAPGGAATPSPAAVIPAITPANGEIPPTEAPVQNTGFTAYELRQQIVYYPEGSGANDAEYLLDATLPFFTAQDEAAARMNESVELYRAELGERVAVERLPFADRASGEDAPSTVVTCEMEFVGDYLNVSLYEDASYGGSAEQALHTFVFDRTGLERSLASLTGVFDPSDLAAQQVLNEIARNASMYYGDITAENVKPALDLFNAFAVTDTGYVLYAATGSLAKPELGILSFAVEKAAFYPEFVGDTVPANRYEALQNAADLMARACASEYLSFSGGNPDALAASGFLSGLLAKRGIKELSEQEYKALFAAYFTGAFPEDIATAGDGTALANGVYTVADAPLATYAVELIDARLDSDRLTLNGNLIYGVPGEADAAVVAGVEVVLIAGDAAEVGYRFEGFAIF
ncbi:MAG: hypothetical protein ABFC62_07780 [Clostridiaceae bacterium]